MHGGSGAGHQKSSTFHLPSKVLLSLFVFLEFIWPVGQHENAKMKYSKMPQRPRRAESGEWRVESGDRRATPSKNHLTTPFDRVCLLNARGIPDRKLFHKRWPINFKK